MAEAAGRADLITVAQRLDGPGTAALPSDGLPGSAWFWLKRGSRWLDYRSIPQLDSKEARA
jgi:hypothetical protein